jgi:hypothetical protein
LAMPRLPAGIVRYEADCSGKLAVAHATTGDFQASNDSHRRARIFQ